MDGSSERSQDQISRFVNARIMNWGRSSAKLFCEAKVMTPVDANSLF